MTDIQSLVESVLRLDKEATKGPWSANGEKTNLGYEDKANERHIGIFADGDEGRDGSWVAAIEGDVFGDAEMSANGDLIAEYRTAAPILATEIIRLRAELAEEKRKVEVAKAALLQVSEAKVFCADSMDIDNHATWAVDEALAALTTPSEKGEGK